MARKKQKPKKKPKKNPPQAIGSTLNASAKRPSGFTHTESGPTRKVPRTCTPQRPANEGAEDVGAPFTQTPATNRMASHSGLVKSGPTIYAEDMEARIVAESRGVTRKDVPWNEFRSTYLWSVKKIKGQPSLGVNSVRKLGGDWEEKQFFNQFCNIFHGKVCCLGRAS